jgi:hypothetical protein
MDLLPLLTLLSWVHEEAESELYWRYENGYLPA